MHDFCHPCVCCFSYSRRSLCGINQGSDYNHGRQGRFQIPDSQDTSFQFPWHPNSRFQIPEASSRRARRGRFQIPDSKGLTVGRWSGGQGRFQIPGSRVHSLKGKVGKVRGRVENLKGRGRFQNQGNEKGEYKIP